jgi:hypothetical protein
MEQANEYVPVTINLNTVPNVQSTTPSVQQTTPDTQPTIPTVTLTTQDQQTQPVVTTPVETKLNLRTVRSCCMCSTHLVGADLGICLQIADRPQNKKNQNDKRLPEITVLPQIVCRICFNKGIQAKEDGKQNYVLRFPDGIATHWLPLYLHDGEDAEHWIRTSFPGKGTKKTKKPVVSKNPVTNYYVLLDDSGSMSGIYNRQCLASITDIVKNTITENDFVSMTTFSNNVKLCFPLLQKKLHADRIMKNINDQCHPSGGTHFYRALYETLEVVDITKPVVMVALTDGEDNDNEQRVYYQKLLEKVQSLKQKHTRVKLMIITVGALTNKNEIQKIVNEAPENSVLISASASASGIQEAYEKVKKLIISKSGGSEDDVLGTSDFLPSAFSLIVNGENGKFDEIDIWRVCARLLNLCVVGFAKQQKALNGDSLREYCDIHRTLMEMLKDNPNVLTSVRKNIEAFMDENTTNNRRREILPDLGEAIQLLSLVDDIQWKTFGRIYMQELFRRHAIRVSFLSDHDQRSVADKVKYYWPQYKPSILLTAFNVYFVNDIVHLGNRTVKDACSFYHNNMGYVDNQQMLNFIGKIEFIRNIDSFNDVMEFLGLPNSDDDIMKLIYYGKTYVAEPQTPTGSFISASNNIRDSGLNVNEVKQTSDDFTKFASNSSTVKQNKRTKKIKHVGWTIRPTDLDSSDLTKLRNICQGKQMKTEFYTAVQFGGDQGVLNDIADKIEHKEFTGQIVGYYSDYQAVVLDALIDGTLFKVVATNPPRGVQPQTLKDNAGSGAMGPRIDLDSMIIKCRGTVNF